jgi:hypothetical protein
VCGVGEDRKLYGRTDLRVYIREQEELQKNPNAADYRGAQHMRAHGSENV